MESSSHGRSRTRSCDCSFVLTYPVQTSVGKSSRRGGVWESGSAQRFQAEGVFSTPLDSDGSGVTSRKGNLRTLTTSLLKTFHLHAGGRFVLRRQTGSDTAQKDHQTACFQLEICRTSRPEFQCPANGRRFLRRAKLASPLNVREFPFRAVPSMEMV